MTLALAACSNTGATGMGTKEGIGTVVGAAGGAWAGSTIGKGSGRIVATAAGTLLGAFIGNQIGRSLDRVDQMYAEQAAQTALERYPDGQYARWNNPNTGNSGYTVPMAIDLPDIELVHAESPTLTDDGLGIVGVGEAGTVGAGAAVMNALNDALAAAGRRRVYCLPLTPERVLRALGALE